ncbi:MAG: sugar transferase [Sandaracinaceae bacterium]
MSTDGTARRVSRSAKRVIDIGLSVVALEAALPVMALLVPAVKLSSPGPLLFVQERVGKDGRVFKMYKLRTMKMQPDGDQPLTWTKSDEDRVTPIGRLLRDYGLDELPQLYNILRGDMSIIGPRPPLPAQVETYTDEQREVFKMRPGVLSLAAVEGRRSLTPERRIELHVEYVRSWSLALDFQILWRSLFVVLGRQDAVDALVDGNS